MQSALNVSGIKSWKGTVITSFSWDYVLNSNQAKYKILTQNILHYLFKFYLKEMRNVWPGWDHDLIESNNICIAFYRLSEITKAQIHLFSILQEPKRRQSTSDSTCKGHVWSLASWDKSEWTMSTILDW